MAHNVFVGYAPDIAQVATHVVGGTAANGQVYTVTINGKAVAYTATGADTNSTIAAALQALLDASTIPEFLEYAWTVNTATITSTANTAGIPGTISSSATGTGSLTTTVTTTATGASSWDNALNWSAGTAPADTEDVDLVNSATDITNGFSQSAIEPATLNFYSSYTGKLGLPRTNGTGSTAYNEFRAQYLVIGAAIINVGIGEGQGSGRIKIDSGTDQTALNVYHTAAPAESGLKSLLWKGTHSSNTANIVGGSVGIGALPGETATIATLSIGRKNPNTNPSVYIGDGATLTTVNVNSGSVETWSGATTINQTGGEVTVQAGSFTNLNLDEGTLVFNSAGALGTVKIGPKGVLDLSRDTKACTFTALDMSPGAKLLDPHKRIGSLVVDIERGRIADVTIDIGSNVRITRGTVS